MNKAKYVVLDGMDGSGKGTQIELLKSWLAIRESSHTAVFTREPGGTPFAEEIRKIVNDHPLANALTPLAQFLLFWAAREELQHSFVAPALMAGKHIFSDRGDSSTFTYQLSGEKHEEFFGLFMLMRNLVFAGEDGRRSPDLYIIFDLPAELARERALRDANRTKSHRDIRGIDYYERVRDGFKKFAEYGRVKFIDATRTPEEVHCSVIEILAEENIVP